MPFTLASEHRPQVIKLMYPHNTEMDLSIAFALYFASRGSGYRQIDVHSTEPQPYSTSARVLLSGLGADELFGGYSRHLVAFERHSFQGLAEELKLDISRIGQRNLGRDDRVMSHWGREVRFPFLDERLIKWAIGAPAWEKCDYQNGESDGGVEPGKRVLRLLALKLGMANVAKEKKRAVCFHSWSFNYISWETFADFFSFVLYRSNSVPGQPKWKPAKSKAQPPFPEQSNPSKCWRLCFKATPSLLPSDDDNQQILLNIHLRTHHFRQLAFVCLSALCRVVTL